MKEREYKSWNEFYPYYLTEHANSTNRAFHFTGTLLVLFLLGFGLATGRYILLLAIPIAGYGFAWIGHFFIEKNRPATFTYPLWSLASDFVMFYHIISFQISDKLASAKKNINNN